MAVCSGENCRISTIEMDEDRIRKAKENFHAHPLGSQISLLEGEASGILSTLCRSDEKYEQCIKNGYTTPSKMCPCSTVYELVGEIHAKAKGV